MIKAKRACWRNTLELRSHTRSGIIREIWRTWKHLSVARGRATGKMHTSFQPWLQWSDFEAARLAYLHDRFSALAAKAVREDDKRYYDSLALRAGEVDSRRGIKQLWKEVAAALPKTQMRKKNNTVAQQPPFADMQKHFDQLEAGDPISFQQLVEKCQQMQSSHAGDVAIKVNLCDMRSRLTIERLCLKAIPGQSSWIGCG